MFLKNTNLSVFPVQENVGSTDTQYSFYKCTSPNRKLYSINI